jgi:hypothetical protein
MTSARCLRDSRLCIGRAEDRRKQLAQPLDLFSLEGVRELDSKWLVASFRSTLQWRLIQTLMAAGRKE